MIVQFSHQERAYIVDNHETDLLLTNLSLQLVDQYKEVNGGVTVEVSEGDFEEFLATLRSELLSRVLGFRCEPVAVKLLPIRSALRSTWRETGK